MRIVALVTMWAAINSAGHAQERIVHPSRAPGVITLLQDQHTALMSYRGRLEGDITHRPIVDPVLNDGDNRMAYGFTGSEDKIIWTVDAPESAEYRVAVHYSGKMYASSDTQVLRKARPLAIWKATPTRASKASSMR